MRIFSQVLVIESPLQPGDAWKKLLPLVKTFCPPCANCGKPLAGGAARFCSACGAPRFPLPKDPQFEGAVSPQSFRISRIIGYRNCCIPVIGGRFEPSAAGTRILLEMKMHPLGWVFLIGGSGLAFSALSLLAFSGDKPMPALFPVLPFAVPCFLGLLCWIFFSLEATIARGTLTQLWSAG